MAEAFLCEGTRTPIGRFGGALSGVRADDLATVPLSALKERCTSVDWEALEDVYYGCTNQAGEDNRNVARMALLLAGLPETIPGVTVNRLCGSGMEAIGQAARAIQNGDADFTIGGGVESMSRAPFVMGKAQKPFDRSAEIYDTTIGWRFVNKKMHQMHGTDAMPETAENVAERYQISRDAQDQFALWSQAKAGKALQAGRFDREITPVSIPQRKGEAKLVSVDEHPRPETTLEQLAKLPTPFREGGTVTAGNASGVNDGAAAMLIASEEGAKRHGLEPKARIIAMTSVGLEPRVMGMGPAPATRKILERTGLTLDDLDVMEINEAFAAQAVAVTRDLGLADDDPRVNPNGGAIAIGHPLGASGTRLVLTAMHELIEKKGRYALCTMCIGVGQGIAMLIERQ